MPRILPDTRSPREDEWANQLKVLTHPDDVPEIADRYPWGVWEAMGQDLRDVFRERARRMLAGDLSVLPFREAPGSVRTPRG